MEIIVLFTFCTGSTIYYTIFNQFYLFFRKPNEEGEEGANEMQVGFFKNIVSKLLLIPANKQLRSFSSPFLPYVKLC